jgi:predicted ribosomally synthesized peptide with SipW-like signal peptide
MKKKLTRLKVKKVQKVNKIKNKKAIISIIVILLLTVIGGTVAYFASKAEFNNSFKGLKYNVDLEEEFNGTWGTKRVRIINREDDNISVLLRISFNEKWEHNGKILSNIFLDEDIVNKTYPNTFQNDFDCHDDGWCYYTREFKGGDEVEVLSAIHLNEELLRRSPDLEEYLASNYSLTVNYETIAYDQTLARRVWRPDFAIVNGTVTLPSDK